MPKVVILDEIVLRLEEDALQFAAQPAMFDAFDLMREFDSAMPDFQRRTLYQSAQMGAIGFYSSRRGRPCPLFLKGWLPKRQPRRSPLGA
jgi:hypothetical protein